MGPMQGAKIISSVFDSSFLCADFCVLRSSGSLNYEL
jgi:hypothetical protein